MALDFLSKVLTVYQANTSDHIKALENLKGAERERAQSTIDAHKKVEASLEGQIKGINKVKEAFGLMQQAGQFAIEAFMASVEHSRLTIASHGANIEKLRQASRGLKTEMDLLRDAARLQAGEFKLNQHQMEMVEQAMLVLQRRGFESQKVNEAVTKSLVSLQTDGLKELGIRVNASGLDMEKASDRAVLYDRVLAKLAETSRDAGAGQQSAQEKVLSAGNTMLDSFDRLKRALGDVVTALEPLFTSLGKIADKISRIVEIAAKLPGGASGSRATSMGALEAGDILDQEFNTAVRGVQAEGLPTLGGIMSESGPSQVTQPAYRFQNFQDKDRWRAEYAAALERDKKQKDRALAVARTFPTLFEQILDSDSFSPGAFTSGFGDALEGIQTTFVDNAYEQTRQQFSSDADAERFSGDRLTAMLNQARKSLTGTGDALSAGDRYAAFAGKRSQSKLEGMFGPLSDFNAYQKAFDTLAGAVGAAMTAWIDGSQSAGKAFKAFIAEAVKGLAVQMAMEALKHGAYAIGSLAFGDVRGAATHGKAAAAFAAGAVVAAAAAKGLHSGSTTPATGAGAAAPTGGGYGGAGPAYAGRHDVMVIGDVSESPRKRARQTRRRVEEAYGSSGSVNR